MIYIFFNKKWMKIKNLKDQDQEIKKSIKKEVIYLILLEYSNSSSDS